jgi:hypothetical protein
VPQVVRTGPCSICTLLAVLHCSLLCLLLPLLLLLLTVRSLRSCLAVPVVCAALRVHYLLCCIAAALTAALAHLQGPQVVHSGLGSEACPLLRQAPCSSQVHTGSRQAFSLHDW